MKAFRRNDQKILNRLGILSLVRQEKEISRASLARKSGLEKSSVSAIVAELISFGLLRQSDREVPSELGGRPSVSLSINPDFCSFMGLEVQPVRYQMVVTNFEGTVSHRESGTFGSDLVSFDDKIRYLYLKFDPLVRSLPGPLAAVGIGIPGIVVPGQGLVKLSVPHQLSNWNVSRVPNPWGVPTVVENDANCCVWATMTEEVQASGKDFLVLLMEFQDKNPLTGQSAGASLGLSVVLEGNIRHGTRYEAGEFRSVFWRQDNQSQTGISDNKLERIIQDSAIMDSYLEEILLNIIPIGSLLAPERIIFFGEAGKAFPRIQALIEGPLAGTWLAKPEIFAKLSQSPLGPEAVATGAASQFSVALYQNREPSRSGSNIIFDLSDLIGRICKNEVVAI